MKKKPLNSKQAFLKLWNRMDPWRDTWNVPYMYMVDIEKVFKAGIRFGQASAQQRDSKS